MTQRNKNILLMLLIIAPFILTMVIVRTFVDLSDLERTNKGTMILPHVQFDALKATHMDGSIFSVDELAGQWNLLYIAAGECDTSCKNSLYYLIKQLRQGLGADAPRVRRLIAHTAEASDELRAFLDEKATGMVELQFDPQSVQEALTPAMEGADTAINHIFLLAPDGQIFMWYPSHEDMQDVLLEADKILYDLKRTLKGSLIG
jgi:cytochrome oxidase Cu insertion factor (SCO1/SenC/PrrC family)